MTERRDKPVLPRDAWQLDEIHRVGGEIVVFHDPNGVGGKLAVDVEAWDTPTDILYFNSWLSRHEIVCCTCTGDTDYRIRDDGQTVCAGCGEPIEL